VNKIVDTAVSKMMHEFKNLSGNKRNADHDVNDRPSKLAKVSQLSFLVFWLTLSVLADTILECHSVLSFSRCLSVSLFSTRLRSASLNDRTRGQRVLFLWLQPAAS